MLHLGDFLLSRRVGSQLWLQIECVFQAPWALAGELRAQSSFKKVSGQDVLRRAVHLKENTGCTQLHVSKRTHQGRRKQFPIQKQLVSFLPASSLSAPASIRNTNSLRSLNEPICHRSRILFVREGGGLDPDLSAPNNYIKVRLHREATSQDNKKRKERASESSQVWGSAALLRGQLPPSRSHLFRHPFIYLSHPVLSSYLGSPSMHRSPLPSVCWERRQGREFTQHCALQALLGGEGGRTGATEECRCPAEKTVYSPMTSPPQGNFRQQRQKED